MGIIGSNVEAARVVVVITVLGSLKMHDPCKFIFQPASQKHAISQKGGLCLKLANACFSKACYFSQAWTLSEISELIQTGHRM